MMQYFRLRRILEDSNAHGIVRYQARFERKHDKKRRKRKEKEFRIFVNHVKTQVKKAFDLERRCVLLSPLSTYIF